VSRRIEIELTSRRHDGAWTWRAAGAREPKGVLAGDLIAFAASVGDELTVEAEFHMDGIEVIEVFESKPKRPMPETLEILGSGPDRNLVTTQLVRGRKSRGADRVSEDRRSRKDRRDRGDRGRQGSRREEEERPKAKRLRPARTHRQALIETLPDEQKPVAEKMVRDGTKAIEQALRDKRKKERDAARAATEEPPKPPEAADKPPEASAESEPEAADKPPEASAESEPEAADKPPEASAESEPRAAPPEASGGDFLDVAGKLLARMRAAEWRDRVDAALAGIDEIDLRDLRSVLGGAEAGAADDEAKALADELRAKLTERVEREHSAWLAEVAATLADGRMVRALRLSARPPKAGVPLPQDMVTRLTEAASAGLTAETPSKRWMMVLGAVAFSPVRRNVQPQGIPDKPDKELMDEVKKLSERVPHIAALFGVEPTPAPRRGRRGGSAPPARR